MKKISLIKISLVAIAFFTCMNQIYSKHDNADIIPVGNERILIKEAFTSKVAIELTKGKWINVTGDGVRELQFYNVGDKGYLNFFQILNISGACDLETISSAKGTVNFVKDKFTFYPIKGEIIFKSSCSNTTTRNPYKTTWSSRFEIRKEGEEILLLEYDEKDINHKNVIFTYHNESKSPK